MATLVLGANGQIGRLIAQEALQKGQTSFGTVRSKKSAKTASEQLILLEIAKNKTSDPSAWEDVCARGIEELKGKTLTVVNTIGGGHPRPGESIRDMNVKPVVAALEGIYQATHKLGIELHLLHLSSTTARKTPVCEYADAKSEVDYLIRQMPIANQVILRTGYVLYNPERRGDRYYLNNPHDYSSLQLPLLPLHPIVGDPDVQFQFVSSKDVVDFAMKMSTVTGKHIIGGVGPSSYTQEEALEFFCKLNGRKMRKITVPLSAARILAEHAAKGHFSPFAVAYIELGGITYDSTHFERILGRRPQDLGDIYADVMGHPVDIAHPPLLEHTCEVIKHVTQMPSAALSLTRAGVEIVGANMDKLARPVAAPAV